MEIPASVDHDEDFVAGIFGTGEGWAYAFNVSTTVATVTAGMGARVIKVRTWNTSQANLDTDLHRG